MKKMLGVSLVAAMMVLLGASTAQATFIGIAEGWGNTSLDAALGAAESGGAPGAVQVNWNNIYTGIFDLNQGSGNAGTPVTVVASLKNDAAVVTAVDLMMAMGSNNGPLYYGAGSQVDEVGWTSTQKLMAGAGYYGSQQSWLGFGDLLTLGSGAKGAYFYTDNGTYTYGTTWNNAGTAFNAGDISSWGGGKVYHLTGIVTDQIWIKSSGNGAWISAAQLEYGGEVPEPGTLLILGGSLLGLCVGGFRRFRKK